VVRRAGAEDAARSERTRREVQAQRERELSPLVRQQQRHRLEVEQFARENEQVQRLMKRNSLTAQLLQAELQSSQQPPLLSDMPLPASAPAPADRWSGTAVAGDLRCVIDGLNVVKSGAGHRGLEILLRHYNDEPPGERAPRGSTNSRARAVAFLPMVRCSHTTATRRPLMERGWIYEVPAGAQSGDDDDEAVLAYGTQFSVPVLSNDLYRDHLKYVERLPAHATPQAPRDRLQDALLVTTGTIKFNGQALRAGVVEVDDTAAWLSDARCSHYAQAPSTEAWDVRTALLRGAQKMAHRRHVYGALALSRWQCGKVPATGGAPPPTSRGLARICQLASCDSCALRCWVLQFGRDHRHIVLSPSGHHASLVRRLTTSGKPKLSLQEYSTIADHFRDAFPSRPPTLDGSIAGVTSLSVTGAVPVITAHDLIDYALRPVLRWLIARDELPILHRRADAPMEPIVADTAAEEEDGTTLPTES
jgi:hypothetical protein